MFESQNQRWISHFVEIAQRQNLSLQQKRDGEKKNLRTLFTFVLISNVFTSLEEVRFFVFIFYVFIVYLCFE